MDKLLDENAVNPSSVFPTPVTAFTGYHLAQQLESYHAVLEFLGTLPQDKRPKSLVIYVEDKMIGRAIDSDKMAKLVTKAEELHDLAEKKLHIKVDARLLKFDDYSS